jgi:membrane-associated phospholipid phosphatase
MYSTESFSKFKERLSTDKRYLYTIVYLYCVLGYTLINKLSTLPDTQLPLTIVDRLLPFTPWTAWIYITIYFLPLFPAVLVSKEEHFKPLAYSFTFCSSVAFVIFMLYPTVCLRPEFEHTGLLTLPQKIVFLVDAPTNCFPSLHVVYAYLSSYFVLLYRRRLGIFLFFWATLVSFSTITTRQHYFYDILSEFFLATFAFYHFTKPTKK